MSLKLLEQLAQIDKDAEKKKKDIRQAARAEYNAEKKRLTDALNELKKTGIKQGWEKSKKSTDKKSTGKTPVKSTLSGDELVKINTKVFNHLQKDKGKHGIAQIVKDTKIPKEDVSASLKIEGNKIQKEGEKRATVYFVK